MRCIIKCIEKAQLFREAVPEFCRSLAQGLHCMLFFETDLVCTQELLSGLVVEFEGESAFSSEQWHRILETGCYLCSGLPCIVHVIYLTGPIRPCYLVVEVDGFIRFASAEQCVKISCFMTVYAVHIPVEVVFGVVGDYVHIAMHNIHHISLLLRNSLSS